MNFRLELPEDTILINRTDLRKVLHEMFLEIQIENNINQVMTIREAAEYLKVSVPTVRKLITNNEIPYFQKGQVIRLNRLDVIEWMRNE